VIAARQHDVGEVGGDRHFTVAHLVEHVLDLVREALDELAFDHAGTALDGVGGTEDGVQPFHVVRVLLKRQQSGLHGV